MKKVFFILSLLLATTVTAQVVEDLQGNKIVSFGNQVANFSEVSGEKWYALYQSRDGGGLLWDQNKTEAPGFVSKCQGVDVIGENSIAGSVAEYMVRFVSTDQEGIYKIQFGTGRYIMNLENENDNSQRLRATESEYDAANMGIYNIVSEDPETGEVIVNDFKFGINFMKSDGSYGLLVHSNDFSNGVATVVTWNSGVNTNVNGNATWEIYELGVAEIDEYSAAMLELTNVFNQHLEFIGSFTDTEPNTPGHYDAEAVAAFDAAMEEANNAIDSGDTFTIEQINALVEKIQSTYQAVLDSKVSFAVDVEEGYYLIQSAPMFYTTTEETVDPETGEVILGETVYMSKGLRGAISGGNVFAAWDTYDATADDRAIFLWKVTKKGEKKYQLRNMGYDVNTTYWTSSGNLYLDDADSTVVFDYNPYVDEEGNKYYNIRPSQDAEREYNYLHCGGHSYGAGEADRVVKWSAGEGGASEWKMLPVSEEDALAMIAAFAPIKDAEVRVMEAAKILADVEPKLLTAQEKDYELGSAQISDVAQLSSPYTETSEGSIDALLDGDLSAANFWHSAWAGGAVDAGIHYLQVELTQPLEEAAFQFTRRAVANDHITTWGVYGTNDSAAEKDACTLLATINTPFGTNNETIISPVFPVGDYTYLRFYGEDMAPNVRGYWHMSEFQLYEAFLLGTETLAEKMGEVFTNMMEAATKASAEKDAISEKTYQELQNAYDAFIPLYNELSENEAAGPVVAAPVFSAGSIIAQGGNTIVLPVAMRNQQDITSFQFDIYLPEGVEFVTELNEYGEMDYAVELAADRATLTHTLAANVMEDGCVRVVAHSSSNEAFSNTKGTLANIKLKVADSVENGVYEIVFRNIRFIEPDSTEHVTDYYTSTLTIENVHLPIFGEGSLEAEIVNDKNYPWRGSEDGTVISSNFGHPNTSSSLLVSYETQKATLVVFSWRNNNAYYHELQLYVDGSFYATMQNSSWEEKQLNLPQGSHVIEFRDIVQDNNDVECYSEIKNLVITEVKDLESVVLSPNSKPLTFVNDSQYPWLTNDGYISSTNYGTKNSASHFSTTFTIDKPSKFSFDRAFNNIYNNEYHYLKFYINGYLYTSEAISEDASYKNISVLLEPGDYHLELVDTIRSSTGNHISYIKNIELSDNWLNIDVATPGTLGVEVLYQVNVLNDVELLKVTGTINETDWTSIKNMKNLIGLDLSEAKFNNVPNYAFDGLSRLSNVELPEGMTSIGQYAFRGTQIWNIDIPNSVTSIGQHAFEGTRVRSVNFTEDSQLQTIGYCAFYLCSSLKEFIMPNTVTKLGSSDNGYSQDYNTSIFSGCHNLKRVHFSDALTTLEQYVCYDCYNLSEVKLPQRLETIRNRAFYNTSSLRNIDFPETLNSIATYAFYNSALDSVKLPIKLTSLSNYAFYNCDNLKYVELPSYISSYDRNFENCNAIQTVVCKSATPPAITNDPFTSGPSKSNITLIVPSFAVANYKLDSYWMQFGNIQEMDVDLDYWRVSGDLMLTNNRRMNGAPDMDLYYGGRLTVSGNAPMEIGDMKLFVSEGNPCRLLNNCEQFTVDSLTTCYSVSSNTWYFFTPMHDVKLSDIKHSANASYVFRYYNAANRAASGTGSSWQNVVSEKLIAGQGYIFHCNANGEIYLPATKEAQLNVFVTSEVTKALETHESENSANKSWNYVGNPYPCYYDIYYMDFTAPITVWDSNNRNYRAYSITDDNFVLRPMQSFFVQKPDAVDNIVFRPEGRQLSSTVNRAAYAPAKRTDNVAKRHIYNIEISGSNSTDQTRVVLNETKSLAYEIECDASKFMSMDASVPQIFTLDAEENRLSINERPTEDGIIPLGVSVGTAGTYTISALRADGEVSLYDAETGMTTDLTANVYTFESDATEALDRFTLCVKSDVTTDLESANKSNVTVSGGNGTITINGANGAEVKIYNVSSSLVQTISNANANSTVNIAKGAYIVVVHGISYKTIVL